MGKIHSIETLGTVDGPGVRFIVFFAGCPMRCLYCHNPDTWEMAAGKEYTADAILARMLRNRPFYKTGGITATGGEPLCQLSFLTELFSLAKKEGIHTTLDTSGILFEDTAEFARLMEVTDLVLLDIKAVDYAQHKALTGLGNERILAFLEHLTAINKPVWIRYVLVPGLTDGEDRLKALGELLAGKSNIEKVEVLPYHKMGEVKYQRLSIPSPLCDVPAANAADAKAAHEKIMQYKDHAEKQAL